MGEPGRPKKEIRLKEFVKLCGLQCTLEEISGWFECSPDTVQRWCESELALKFSDAFERYSKRGHASLRRKQWQVGLSGNVTMLIWLGKQYLKQKDKSDAEIDAEKEAAKLAQAPMTPEQMLELVKKARGK